MRAGLHIARRKAGGRTAAFALAFAGSGAALAISLALVPIGGDDSIPGLLFVGAVGLSGWYGGLGPALLSTACGALALDYFFEVPHTNDGTDRDGDLRCDTALGMTRGPQPETGSPCSS
jgi:hypothetical protein